MNNRKIGGFIALIGLYYLLRAFGIINVHIGSFWPLALLIPGLIFEINYFKHNLPSGVLVPGGILLTQGLLFVLCEILGYSILGFLWPVFPLSVAVGLFQFYWFGNVHKSVMWTAFGIGAGSLLFLMINTFALNLGFITPIILIIIGFGIYKSDVIIEHMPSEKDSVDL